MEKKTNSPDTAHPETLSPVHEKIESYLQGLLGKHDEPVLLEMEELAIKHDFPIIGRLVGSFLKILTQSIDAKRIFEFGSGFGYSAYWLSMGMNRGELMLTDGSKSNIETAKKFLTRLDRKCEFKFHFAWSQDVFNETQGDFGIVYNDADKGDYPEIWQLARQRIASGGFYIADNTLWYGRVATGNVDNDIEPGWTEAIVEHNSLIFNDLDFDAFINPIRDGVLVARRK
jgi:predicted O-methyltransferase YrrM